MITYPTTCSNGDLLKLSVHIGGRYHNYKNLNRGGHFDLTEAGKPTASVQRSRLIVALTEAGIISQINQGGCAIEPASVNVLTEGVA